MIAQVLKTCAIFFVIYYKNVVYLHFTVKLFKMINGNTLIELGYKPEKWFKDAIDYANANELQGLELVNYLKSVCPPPVIGIEPHKEPLHYHKNILAETEDEIENLKSVIKQWMY